MTVERPADEEFERQLPVAAIVDEYLALADRRPITAWIGSRATAPEPRGPFRASGGGCLRRDILRWDGKTGDPIPGISLRRFAVGNLIESVIEEAFRWKGVLLTSQARVWCDWALRPGHGHRDDWEGRTMAQGPRLDLSDCLLSGTLDAVVCWTPDWASVVGPITPELIGFPGRTVFLVDWKSCHERKLDYLDTEPVDESYRLQVGTYLWLARAQWHWPIEQARLVYVGKDTMRIRQVGFDLEAAIRDAKEHALDKRAAAEAVAAGAAYPSEIPLNNSGKPAWQCDPRYCEFALTDHCPEKKAYWTNLAVDRAAQVTSGANATTMRRIKTKAAKTAKEQTNGHA